MVEKTKKQWDKEMINNQSFYGRAFDICNILNITIKDLKEYWLNVDFGLIYIQKYALKYGKLPEQKTREDLGF